MPRSPEAAREAARRYRQESYRAYKQLCELKGVKLQTKNWWPHYKEIRDPDFTVQIQATEPPLVRLTLDEHRAYFLEVRDWDWIKEVGGGLV